MRQKSSNSIYFFTVLVILVSFACSTLSPTPVPTHTPQPTATQTSVPTLTQTPTATPRPTFTPNIAATARMDELQAEAQRFFDLGYLDSTEGRFREFDDFSFEWAQLGFYRRFLLGTSVRNFYISAHFAWESAYQNADISGCGIAFASQEDGEHYAVFLDRARVLFVDADNRYNGSRLIGPTRGHGRVQFSLPAEADFTLIVNDAYAYVLVDGDVVGEYTLSQSRRLHGDIGLTVLSGTNKDYGTRCEMTNIHAWIPR